MRVWRNILAMAVLGAGVGSAQSGCTSTPTWTACDITFDITAAENNADLRAEFRSPRYKTLLLNAFRQDGKLVIRFAPTGAGAWDYRLTSNLARYDGKTGQIQATESNSPGFVRTANVHHFTTENLKQHLWMSTAIERFTAMPRAEFDVTMARRADEKFTHLRLTIDAMTDLSEAAERIRAVNAKGLTADLVMAAIPPERRERERWTTEMASRFAGFNITWAGDAGFEQNATGRQASKEFGQTLVRADPYLHPRAAIAQTTSAPLMGDTWMNLLSYGVVDPNVGAVEHQFFQLPALNTGIHSRADLWNATMNGQYPASGEGPYMKVWADFMATNRYWELEPYFDVDGGRALALDGVDYIVYVEKPALVELTVEKHGYDVVWMNPASGETIKQKEYNGEHFTGEPPDKTHDWVLRLSREDRKEGMLKSYKFDSRRVPVQEVEQEALRIPFEIASPEGNELSFSRPAKFSLKTKRESRATRSVLVEWTADVIVDGLGYRVVGRGREGTLEIPRTIATRFPAVMSLRVQFLNANGKAYALDKVYRLTQ